MIRLIWDALALLFITSGAALIIGLAQGLAQGATP